MKFTIAHVLLVSGLTAISTPAQEVKIGAESFQVPDQKKVSYALGMDLALQIKRLGADVDVKTIVQALKDVQEGNPTQLKESELRAIFRQEEVVERAGQSVKNKAEGEAFLAKNSKAEGVTALPDGLQYRVLEPGLGEMPKASDAVVVNYKGTFVDGTEFEHKDNFTIPVSAPIKGWQEALLQMKTGSKWKIFIPSGLAYGHKAVGAIGPDAALVFEIELIAIKPPSAEK